MRFDEQLFYLKSNTKQFESLFFYYGKYEIVCLYVNYNKIEYNSSKIF